jgi:FkbM family methyltransferase
VKDLINQFYLPFTPVKLDTKRRKNMVKPVKRVDTRIGSFFIRDEDDMRVLKEVYEDDEYRRWGDMQIHKGNIVIDAGAHIGIFSKLASTMGAYVYAIEPHNENFEMLKMNMRGRGCKLIKGLLGDGNDAPFMEADRNDLHKIDPSGIPQPTLTLDGLMDRFELTDVHLLKMDIEGAEYPVLYNTKNFDRIHQITMEWHYGSTKMAELIIFLEQKGFKTVWLGGNGDWGKLQLKHL